MTGAVLAGGLGRRFGSNKPLAPWDGKTLVEAVVSRVAQACGAVLVVVKAPADFAFLAGPRVRILPDGCEEHHPLRGLIAALEHAATEKVFVCACDMPFISPALIRTLAGACEGRLAAVPVWKSRPQPLCAVYDRACLEPARRLLAHGRPPLQALLEAVDARRLEDAEPGGRSFIDLDTPEDYAAARYGLRTKVRSSVNSSIA